jgi:ketosteroid isomerase-like protein
MDLATHRTLCSTGRFERLSFALVPAGGVREAIDRWFRAFNARQFDDLAAILADVADAEVIQEWPQSGERIRGRDNILAILENFPGLPDASVHAVRGTEDKWVLTPSWTPLRITGSGDHYTVEGRVAYPSGEVWNFVDVFEFRSGKVVKLTEYFAPPFPAAEWRAKWVEKMESANQ